MCIRDRFEVLVLTLMFINTIAGLLILFIRNNVVNKIGLRSVSYTHLVVELVKIINAVETVRADKWVRVSEVATQLLVSCTQTNKKL